MRYEANIDASERRKHWLLICTDAVITMQHTMWLRVQFDYVEIIIKPTTLSRDAYYVALVIVKPAITYRNNDRMNRNSVSIRSWEK